MEEDREVKNTTRDVWIKKSAQYFVDINKNNPNRLLERKQKLVDDIRKLDIKDKNYDLI